MCVATIAKSRQAAQLHGGRPAASGRTITAVVRQSFHAIHGWIVMTGNRGTAILRRAACCDDGVSTGGIALKTDVSRVLASELLFARLAGQIADALARRLAVSLRLFWPQDQEHTTVEFELFCRGLAHALDLAGVDKAALEITLTGQTPQPGVAWQVRRDALAAGPLNILCDEPSMSASAFWLQLWDLRTESNVRAGFWPLVTSPCALLAAEHADNIVPGLGLQAPSESAWTTATLNLNDYADSSGELDDAALALALEDVFSKAESAHITAEWPTAVMQHDAWMNRRLAIRVDGLADYAQRCGLAPERHESLQRLRQILLRIRQGLRLRSQQQAKTHGSLPALDLHNPAAKLPLGPQRDRWESRWLSAVKQAAVRHRNLLVLSPWAFFPRGNADLRWMDLLPLLRLADACVFRDRPDVSHWNINEFKHFHRRAWALMRRIEADTLVAERL